jgi:hypothetical protein
MKIHNNKQEAIDAVDLALEEILYIVESMGLKITYGDRAETEVSTLYLDEDGVERTYSEEI